MADVLDLPAARKALRIPAGDTADDDDLTSTYIPAVTAVVESLAGPQTSSTAHSWKADGGGRSVLLPSAVTAVTAVTENGLALGAGDYFVDLAAGLLYRGAPEVPLAFQSGTQNIVVTYDTAVTAAANVILAARIILIHLWQADNQGGRPDLGGGGDDDLVETPVGYLIPRRAYQLLVGVVDDVPGFA